jgi:hypothetical protein
VGGANQTTAQALGHFRLIEAAGVRDEQELEEGEASARTEMNDGLDRFNRIRAERRFAVAAQGDVAGFMFISTESPRARGQMTV